MNEHTPMAHRELGAPEPGNCEPGSLPAFRHKARKAGFDEAEIERLIEDYFCRIEHQPHGQAAKQGVQDEHR